jgi:hypothetical protein
LYKKYILKRGKRIGPYFYTSARLKDGRIKTVYLGSNEKLARQKERTQQLIKVVKKRG